MLVGKINFAQSIHLLSLDILSSQTTSLSGLTFIWFTNINSFQFFLRVFSDTCSQFPRASSLPVKILLPDISFRFDTSHLTGSVTKLLILNSLLNLKWARTWLSTCYSFSLRIIVFISRIRYRFIWKTLILWIHGWIIHISIAQLSSVIQYWIRWNALIFVNDFSI